MDYDDNDFQSQSFQLAGEENIKFSPGLHPYSLPKFDLDENLQVHLRYDNLVDSEVLLGIQSHEENQWIEDFSRGSSGIEFSSSAPESCSISRHHNVWSEATSTESVEMLLKSVGQDDMIIGQTVIDEQENLRNQMESNLNRDGSAPSQVGDSVDMVSTLPRGKCVESPSLVSTDFADELHKVEGTFHADGAGKSQGEGSEDMDLIAGGEKCKLGVLEGDICDNETCNKTKQKEESHLIDKSKENASQDGSTIFKSTRACPSDVDVQSFTVSAGNFANQYALQPADSLQKDTAEKLGQPLVLSKETQMAARTHEGSGDKNSEVHLEMPSDLVLKDDSMMKMTELSDEALFSENTVNTSKWKDVVPTDTERHDQFTGNSKEALDLAAGHSSSEMHSSDISFSSVGIPSSTVLMMHPFERQKIQGHDNAEVSEKWGNLPDRDSDELVGVDSVSNKESSINIICESCATENLKDDDSLGVHEAEFGAGVCISSSMPDESVQRCDRNLPGSGPSDIQISHTDVSIHGKEHAKLSIDSVSPEGVSEFTKPSLTNSLVDVPNMLSASNGSEDEVVDDKETMNLLVPVEHSIDLVGKEETLARISMEPSLLVQTMSLQMAGDPVAVSEVEKRVGCDTAADTLYEIVGHSFSSGGNVSVMCQNDSQALADDRGAQQCSDELGDCTPIKDSSMVENESAEHGSIEVAGTMLGDETCKLPVMQSLEEPSCDINTKDMKDNKDSENNNDGQDLHAGIEVDSLNGFENSSRPATLLESEVEFHASEAGTHNLNSNVPNCGSPTIISCSEATQNEIDQGGGRGSLDQNAFVSDDMERVVKKDGSSTHDLKESAASEDDRTFTFKVNSLAELSEGDNGNGWKPFSNMQPYASNQSAETSASVSESCQIVHSTLQETSSGCAQTSGGKDIPQSVENSADYTTESLSGGPAENGTTKEGMPLKDETPQSAGVQGSKGKDIPVTDKIDLEGNKVEAAAQNPRENNAVEADSSFTFELASLSSKETGNGWRPSTIQPFEFPETLAVPPTTSGLCQIEPKVLREIPRESPRTSGVKNVRRSSKVSAEDKAKPSSSKATDKEISKEGKSLKEISSPKKTKARGSNLFVATPSSLGDVIQVGQSEGMRSVGYFEGSGKPSAFPTVQTSNLPDLNTSASPSVLFQQPFTDSQQVQLRAQIFVYGSLIQGSAPDEACMRSAFGESDGGRSSWEPVWRGAVERIQSQKSPFSSHEIPVLLHSGARVSEPASRQSIHQNDPLSTPGRAGSKGTPSANIHSAIPFSSPLWTISTPGDDLQSSGILRGSLTDSHKPLLPYHPYHSPHLKHYAGNTPWHPQAPSSGTWVLTPQTTSVDLSAHYPALSISDTVHVASVRESSVPHASAMQHVSPSPFIQAGVSASVPVVTPLPVEAKRMAASASKHAPADSKSRKRKKTMLSEDNAPVSSLVQTQTDSVSAGAHLPTSISITAPVSSALRVDSGSVVSTSSPMPSTHYQIVGGRDTDQRVIFSEETSSRIEQAKQQAEDAAAFAASAVRHSQSIWSQLAMQKNSGLVSDNEAKLASSAVAIAAAASVAKAAAAAARVAADAALQAKLMADEALIASKSRTPIPEASLHDGAKNLGKISPSSILKGRDATGTSDSVLVTARETARKRVEAASAAAKRAENLDAVVKAAEMAAEAVSQAGIIIAMGEPIPLTLSELVESGPENYWRTQQTSSEQLVKSNHKKKEQTIVNSVEEGLGRSPLNMKETKRINDQVRMPSPNEMSRRSMENQMWMVNGIHLDTVKSSERGLNVQNGCNTSDLAKTIGVVPESQIGSTNASITFQNEYEGRKLVRTPEENGIEEGSLVEVLSFEKSGIRVWYSAKVLNLKDREVHVCYTERVRDEGSGQPTEWVPLEVDKAPRIRIAHSMSLIKYEGAKKRRRAARGDYAWSVGDKVDAWIQNSWWEGVITEKSNEDETNLTFQFSAQGDTSVVKAWHLRPSLVWDNGQWIEWSRSRESNFYSNEGDMSQQKPLKKGRHGPVIEPAAEAGGKDNMPNRMGVGESGKTESSRALALSAKEKIFTVGKSSKEDNNSNTVRTKRIGLQKEGSKVVFGVPKPGKKRKFMEVSKHYVADGTGKINAGNDSIKFAKFLIPQESASRGWKNTSKVVSKGKRVVESKPKTIKSGKTQNALSRSMSEKDSSSISTASGLHHGTAQDHLANVKGSVNGDDSMSEMQNLQEVGYFPNNSTTAEITTYSMLDASSDAPSKKKFSSAVPADLGSKVKTARPSEKIVKNDEKNVGHSDNIGKSVPNAMEPRRSSRKIQPTSRLLEGLQSSLIISKIPVISHEKGTKGQQRAAPSRGSSHG